MPIIQGKVDIKDDLACIGYVDQIEELKFTKPNSEGDSDYAMFNVIAKGLGGSRGGRLNFLFRPEWLQSFDPTPLQTYTPPPKADGTERKEGSMYTVYKNHVGGTNSRVSNLAALCGSPDAWAEFQNKVDAAAAAKGDLLDAAECYALIKDFVLGKANEGVSVGYVMKQDKDQNGELRDGYAIDQFFYNTEKQRQAWERRSAQLARQPKRPDRPGFRIAYEPY